MSTAVVTAGSQRAHRRATGVLARAAAAAGGLGLGAGVFLGWDGGIRDTGYECGWTCYSPLATDPRLPHPELGSTSALGLLVPFGLALLIVAAALLRAAARGRSDAGTRFVLALAGAATASLLIRQALDGAPGLPPGSRVGAGAILLGAAGLALLPRSAGRRATVPPLVLAIASAALLTGMVHDGYAAVDVHLGRVYEYGNGSGGVFSIWWEPRGWLAATVGARTTVDLGLIAAATLGLIAAVAAHVGRLPRVAAAVLALAAAAALAGLGVLAIGADPAVTGVDRFPAAVPAALAVLAIGVAGLWSARSPRPRAEPRA